MATFTSGKVDLEKRILLGKKNSHFIKTKGPVSQGYNSHKCLFL